MTLALALAAAAQAAEPPAGQRTFDGRTYYVQATSTAAPKLGIVLLHGAVHEVERGISDFYRPYFAAAKAPVVVAYPIGRRGACRWDAQLFCWAVKAPGDDAAFLRELVAELRAETGVEGWTAVGISNGGYYLAAAVLSGTELPFKRVVNFIGGQGWYEPPAVGWRPDVTVVVGKRDADNGPYGREFHATLEGLGYGRRAKLRFIEFDGGHDVPYEVLTQALEATLQ